MRVEYARNISRISLDLSEKIQGSRDMDSPEFKLKYVLEATALFFEHYPEFAFENLWLGSTYSEVGAALQIVTGPITENRNLVSLAQAALNSIHEAGSGKALQAWEISDIDLVFLAEVEFGYGFRQLGWFRRTPKE